MSYGSKIWAGCFTLAAFTAIGHTLDPSVVAVNNPAFKKLLGSSFEIVELTRATSQLYHEAGAYHAPTKSLWVNSDIMVSDNKTISRDTFRITGLESPGTVNIERINTSMPNPIGGVPSIRTGPLGDVILFVAQGLKEKTPPGGVYALNPYAPYNTSLVLGSYGDYPFNSLDDIAMSSDGTIYVSDPAYGYGEGNRPLPILPDQVYAFNPSTKDTRVAADGFGRPNGLALNAEGSTLYIGDTGAQVGNGTTDVQGPRTIYAFDRHGLFLQNRHVFAMPQALASAPDGIKVDTQGNVWAAAPGAGVVVWDEHGTLLGSIKLKGTPGNLGFGEAGELFVLCGDRIFRLNLSTTVVGVGVH